MVDMPIEILGLIALCCFVLGVACGSLIREHHDKDPQ